MWIHQSLKKFEILLCPGDNILGIWLMITRILFSLLHVQTVHCLTSYRWAVSTKSKSSPRERCARGEGITIPARHHAVFSRHISSCSTQPRGLNYQAACLVQVSFILIQILLPKGSVLGIYLCERRAESYKSPGHCSPWALMQGHNARWHRNHTLLRLKSIYHFE
jgi:hypothetical protein